MVKRKRFWFGLIITLGFLGFFVYRTDFDEIADAFRQADYVLAFVSVPLYFVGFWIRTVRWRILLRPVREVSTARLYPVVLIGLMANNVLPARVGELVRAYLVGERESASKPAVLGTIAVDRVFDGLTLVAILGIVTAFSGADATVRLTGIGTAVVFLGAAVVLVGLAFSPDKARTLLLALLRRLPLPAAIELKLEELIDSFIVGLSALRNPGVLLLAALLTIASWSVETSLYWMVGEAFNLNVGLHVYFLIAAAANLALSILASPGGVGPFEVTTQAILIDIFGVGQAQASAYAIALHALLLGPVIVVGFVLLWLTQLKLSDIMGGGASSTSQQPLSTAIPAPPAVE